MIFHMLAMIVPAFVIFMNTVPSSKSIPGHDEGLDCNKK